MFGQKLILLWMTKLCHCEERSNRELYRADLYACDCFVLIHDKFVKKKSS
jgi:hypothetical protein